jgi:predicted esterase
MTHEHTLTVPRTARYYTLGTLSERTRNIWFVLHGYGQLAQHFIRRFDVVANDETLVVAPEGLSRLYLNGEYSKVGASWITREARDHEVSDYITYLNQLYDSLLGDHDPAALTITLMGFSQGAATACRWLNAGHIRVERLMLWAGFFSNGLADIIDLQKLTNVPTQYVYGLHDEYIKQMPDPAAYLNQLKTDLPSLDIIPFEGKHTVEREVLKRLV